MGFVVGKLTCRVVGIGLLLVYELSFKGRNRILRRSIQEDFNR